ncbi:MAG: hypothetical protein ACYSWO_28635 [Planctomycetota bacterium]|jgi:hypothetical protein
MTTNQILIESAADLLLEIIDCDTKRIAAGQRTLLLRDHPQYGTLVPFTWCEEFCIPMKESWDKFMHGRAYCDFGFYVDDVTQYLNSKKRKVSTL